MNLNIKKLKNCKIKRQAGARVLLFVTLTLSLPALDV
jgi:hypothetical protein